ncbi:hypothetical protein QBC37DRAFT_432434 [Rhypophila decipiens]|uniref:Uncharacterized protein n=1 Tax=Rhypophila decipiens TaxID=261697 RepID=A0AAN6XWU5_9PEZI|nr:hypothetical protein QBC37DRAFT_432434 [Rhypophila decipiens]
MSSTTTVPSPNAFGTAIPQQQQQQQQAHSQSAACSATVSLSVPAAPGPTPSVQLGNDADISSTKALKQSFIKTNPIYADSFGAQAFERTTSYGLKIIGWRVIGKAQQRWQRLEPSLLSLLVSKREVLYSKRPPGLIMDPPCALRCFLLGPDKDHATPYATVLCGMPWLRKAMGKLITKSGLLIPDDFDCCGLPDKPELYGRVDFGEDSDERSRFEEGSVFPGERDQMKQLPGTGTAAMKHLDGFDMQYISKSGSGNANQVAIFHHDTRIGEATIGGVIVLDDQRFEMTVRHVFRPPPSSPSNFSQSLLSNSKGANDPDGLEIDFFDSDSESEHVSDTEEESPPTSEPATNKEPAATGFQTMSTDPTSFASDRFLASATAATLTALGVVAAPFTFGLSLGLTAGAVTVGIAAGVAESHYKQAQDSKKATKGPNMQSKISLSAIFVPPNLKLDYALRGTAPARIFESLTEVRLRSNVSFASPDDFTSPDQVVIKTPSRPKTATPDSTGIIGPIPIDDELSIPPQRVQVVSLAKESQIIPGECGSWAMNRDGEFTGMLIGSCPSLGEAYLLPMSDILEDISEQTGLSAKVARNFKGVLGNTEDLEGKPISGAIFELEDV